MATILVVEDEPGVRALLSALLTAAGHRLTEVEDGREGLRVFHNTRPELVILDIGLPSMDGWTVLDRLRELSDVPILMITGQSAEADKVRGLRAGADDYLAKPFGNEEVLARVEALLRRARGSKGADLTSYDDGMLRIDFGRRNVSVRGCDITTTPTEFALIVAFARNPDQVLSLDQLLRLAWRDEAVVGPDRVKFTIHRLRKKLAGAGIEDFPLDAVRGFGYRYQPPRTR